MNRESKPASGGGAEVAPQQLLDAAVAAAEKGASVLEGYFRSGRLEDGSKGENDFVTQADRESEAALVGEILRRFRIDNA